MLIMQVTYVCRTKKSRILGEEMILSLSLLISLPFTTITRTLYNYNSQINYSYFNCLLKY